MFQLTIKKSLLCALALSVTVSCTTKVGANRANNSSRQISSTQQLPMNNKAGAFVFRSRNDANNQVTVNVYVDGSYLTSLKKGEYQYVDLCPGQHYIEFAYANHDPAYLKKLNRSQAFELRNGEVFYTEVLGDGRGGVNMRRSSKENVEKLLPNLHLQQRTISRVISGGC